MNTIKSFEQFTQAAKPLDEGLIAALKARKEIIQLQCAVCDEYERLLQENPKKFKDGKSVLNAVRDFASKAYEKIVKTEGAMSLTDWWEGFAEANARMLDNTVFRISVSESVNLENDYVGSYTTEITFNKDDEEYGRSEMEHAKIYTQSLTEAGLEVDFKQKRFAIEATVTYNNKEEFDTVVRFAAFDMGETSTVIPKLSKKMYDEVSKIVLQNSKPKLFR